MGCMALGSVGVIAEMRIVGAELDVGGASGGIKGGDGGRTSIRMI